MEAISSNKMIQRGLFILVCLFFTFSTATAQKIKYKDLLVLLNAKQYDQAEPFLKKFLKENKDETSAYLFMGIIYQEKALKTDALKETAAALSNIDSALINYAIFGPRITEKELKRNDEEYQMYTRRDYRTGEFGIKLSDVQLDLENRTKSLKERKERILALKKSFTDSEAQYKRAQVLYKYNQAKFSSEKEFYLRSDEQVVSELTQLAAVFDSSQVSFKNCKTIQQALGKSQHNQVMNLQEIRDFKKEGGSEADFMNDDLKVWNYSAWSQGAQDAITKEVIPMREQMIALDIEINKLRDKLRKDSTSVKKELAALNNKSLFSTIHKFDKNAMPVALFDMKIAELDYNSDLLSNKKLRDTSNVAVRLAAVRGEFKTIKQLDSLTDNLMSRDFEKEAVDYKHFVSNAYGTPAVLKSLVKTTKEYALREALRKEKELASGMQSLKWLVASPDSIPLFTEGIEKRAFKPLVIAQESYTVGLKYADSLAVGYFYTITPSRIPDIKLTFPVDTKNFKKRNLPLIKGLSAADTDKTYYALIYSESKVNDKFPVTVARINRETHAVAWSLNYFFDLLPAELKFADNELSVKTSSPNGDSKIVVIDTNGKRLQ